MRPSIAVVVFLIAFQLNAYSLTQWTSKLRKQEILTESLKIEIKEFAKQVDRTPSEKNLEELVVIANWLNLNEETTFSSEIINQGLRIAKRGEQTRLEFHFLVLLANNCTDRGNYFSADSIFRITQKMADENDWMNDLDFGIAKANYLSVIGERLEAIKIYERVGRKYKTENRENYAVVLTNIGEIYKDLGLYQQAIVNFNLALKEFGNLKLPKREVFVRQHLAVCYMRNDQLDSALFHLNKGLMEEGYQLKSGELARYFSSLSNIYRRKKQYKIAHSFVDSSMKIAVTNGMSMGVLINKVNKSEIYFDEGDFQSALKILNPIGGDIEKMNFGEIKLEYLRIKGLILERLGNLALAIQLKNEYIELKGKLEREENANLILEIGNSLGKEISQSEIQQLNFEIENERNRNWWISLVLLSSLMISLISIRAWRIQKRKNELEIQVKEGGVELSLAKAELEKKEKIIESMEVVSEVGFIEKSLESIQQMKKGSSKEQIQTINSVLEILGKNDSQKIWKDFELSYSEVHEEFFQKLKTIAPTLTPNEIKICSLIHLNLSTKEIAGITHRTPGRIDNIRSVIRKKINLDAEINLTSFLREL